MSPKEFGAVTAVLVGIGVVIAAFFGNAVPLIVALILVGLMFIGNRQEHKTNQATPAKRTKKESKSPRKTAQKTPPRAKTASTAVAEASRRLRFFAAHFDHGNSDTFFHLSPVGVVRETAAQQIVGPGAMSFTREGTNVVFRNQNSPNAKPRTLNKKWKDVLGFSAGQPYKFYYQDTSSVQLIGLEPRDRIIVSAIWEVMLEVMRPPLWNNGPKRSETIVSLLRQCAQFLDDNPGRVNREGEVNWDELLLDSRFLGVDSERLNQAPDVGDRFDNVILRKKLGQGGFGSVFVAESVDEPETLVALKIMKLPDGITPWSEEFSFYAKQFVDESVLSSRFFDVPYVASAFDHGLEPWPWISYPLLSGVPVSDVTGLGVLKEDYWWNVAHDLVSALYFIHRQGIVHRDIHFDNVMLLPDRAMVLDFGISHVSGHSQLKGVARAWPYSSPEALRARKPEDLTASTDIFSAGLVLFQTATGFAAWPRGDNPAERLENLTASTPDFSTLSVEQRELLEPMLALDPSRRPTAHDLLFLIAPHVDMEAKTRELEEEGLSENQARRTEQSLIQGEPYPDPDPIRGPLSSWVQVKQTIEWIIEEVCPRFFVVNIDTRSKPSHLYFQAITDGETWTIEAMSDRFADATYEENQRRNFLALDWSAPSENSPNYQKSSDSLDADPMITAFIDAFEIAFNLSVTDIKKVSFTIQGSGMYLGSGGSRG